MRLPSLLPLLLTVSSTAFASPAVSVTSAAADLSKVAEADRQYVRYQSLYAVPVKDREAFMRVYAFVVNSLSRKARLRKPADLLVTPDLIRIDLRDFKWDASVYDRLADADPYYHAVAKLVEEETVTELWPGGNWTENGVTKYYPKGAFQYQRKVPGNGKKVTGIAPWLPADKAGYLVEQTQSKAPVLRADWFLVQVSLQESRTSGYYDFLGLKSRADYFNLIGFNEKLAKEREREFASILHKSGVSELSRQVYRFGANDGGYWQTRDAFNASKGNKNAVNALNGDYKHDAEEHYGFLPNGLFAYYLSNAAGVQQNFAPPEIGFDSTSTNNGGRIHIFKSCVTCHKEGLRPLNGYAERIFRGRSQLVSFDKGKFERLSQLYLQPLNAWYDRDVRDFSNALAQINGPVWTTSRNSIEYGKVYKAWAEDDVTVEQAAIEVGDGATAIGVVEALKKYATPVKDGGLGQLVPNTLLAYMHEDDKGKSQPLPMLREHFEEAYPYLQYAVRGIVPK